MSMVLVRPKEEESRVIRALIEASLADAWVARIKRRYGEEMSITPTDRIFIDVGGLLLMGAPTVEAKVCGCTFVTQLDSVPYMSSLGQPTTRADWSEELGTTLVAVHMRHLHLIMSLEHAQELLGAFQKAFDTREAELDAFYSKK